MKKAIGKLLKDGFEDSDDEALDDKLKVGGYLNVSAFYTLGPSSTFIWNGVWVELDLSKKTNPLAVYVVADVGFTDDLPEKKVNLPILSDEDKLFTALTKVSLQAVRKGLKEDSLRQPVRTALTKLQRNLQG